MDDTISRQAAIDALIAEGRNVDSRYLESERIIHEADAVEVISMLPSARPDSGYIEQIKWERDLAIRQLADLGYGLGEKPRTNGDLISRQELLESIERISVKGNVLDDDWIYRFIQEFPSAQPEPCEDAVSRTFMYELGATCIAKPDGNGNLIALGRIDMLPPVTPKRKTGKWNFIGNQMFECSECGTCYTQSQFYQMRVRISDTEFPKFCPNCSADMRGEQDE